LDVVYDPVVGGVPGDVVGLCGFAAGAWCGHLRERLVMSVLNVLHDLLVLEGCEIRDWEVGSIDLFHNIVLDPLLGTLGGMNARSE
jgi:hypothetical protein